jgi:membrane dipeptidase
MARGGEKPELKPAVADGHVDLLYEMMEQHRGRCFHELSDGPVTLAGLRQAQVRFMALALYCPDSHNGPGTSTAYLTHTLRYADRYLTGLTQIRTRYDLDNCYQGGEQIGTVFLLENADALVDGTVSLDQLSDRGLRVVGLTHAGRNRIGDGNGVRAPAGLTVEGRRVLRALAEGGFAVDVAHLSDPCFWEVVEGFDGPLLSSHTGFRFFCPGPRNLDEEQLRVISERKGMVGVAVNPEMLSPEGRAGTEIVFKHLDWAVERYGLEAVGLGSDFCGFSGVNHGLEDISRLPALVELFVRHGYPPEAIASIMGDNWYRFYSSLLAAPTW